MLSPFRGFYDVRSEVDRLFSEMLGGLSRRGVRQEGGVCRRIVGGGDLDSVLGIFLRAGSSGNGCQEIRRRRGRIWRRGCVMYAA
jgi:hypothetical protein